MKAIPFPDQQLLQASLDYDPQTGLLVWKRRPEFTFNPTLKRTASHLANAFNATYAGKPAFTAIAKNLYLKGAFNAQNYYAHRIIYKMVTGHDPLDVDHDDGNRQNNKWGNLFSKSRGDNLKNRRLSSNNTSGYHGVSFHTGHQLWAATIYDNGKCVSLGWFADKEHAITARKTAEVFYGYHPNHGRT